MIRDCKISEKNKLKKFIKKNYGKNHILSRDDKILNWYYLDFKKYNFLIKIHKNKILGFLGYIKNSRFNMNKSDDIIWLSPWSKLKKNKINFSGIEFIHHFQKKFKKYISATTGCNDKAKKIFQILGFKVGQLNHYYLLNRKLNKFYLCNINKKKINKKITLSKKYEIKKISKLELLKIKYDKKKDYLYFKNKYEDNPFYNYFFLTILKKKRPHGFFVCRISSFNKRDALRIVDFNGDHKIIKHLGGELIKFIEHNGYEYLDFYNFGINKKYFLNAGFNEVNNKVVIPNYFEPYVRKNIKINFAVYPKTKNLILYKGDCDQERPSMI